MHVVIIIITIQNVKKNNTGNNIWFLDPFFNIFHYALSFKFENITLTIAYMFENITLLNFTLTYHAREMKAMVKKKARGACVITRNLNGCFYNLLKILHQRYKHLKPSCSRK